jgi:hypothetical protein
VISPTIWQQLTDRLEDEAIYAFDSAAGKENSLPKTSALNARGALLLRWAGMAVVLGGLVFFG